jgi:single-stranded-DNA-specific exonuclease
MRAQPFRWIPRGEPFQKQPNGQPDSFPPILEHLVRQRGLPEGMDLDGYLRPRLKDLADPFLIPDMQIAVERILHAIDQGQKICIYGDYDVDGVASITLMRKILMAYGLEPRHFIPQRGPEGYGLSLIALERCRQEGPKPDLLITVDCGTVSIHEVAALRADGIDVIIVDDLHERVIVVDREAHDNRRPLPEQVDRPPSFGEVRSRRRYRRAERERCNSQHLAPRAGVIFFRPR